ncbi:MAG: metal-sulfur cluster assembly factor [Alphaproteobacteria bacterium]|nr:metal-sulfur cluster assembly factor [Alphaproteobacteria bacterium]
MREGLVFDGNIIELPQMVREAGSPLAPGVKPIADKEEIIKALKLVFDPDVDLDIYNMGLVYDIKIKDSGDVDIAMTLTSPTCPHADMMIGGCANAAAGVPGVGRVIVNLVWTPEWNLSMLSEEAKYQLELGDLNFDF